MLSYSTGDTVAATLCSALLWYLLHIFAICVCCGVWWSKWVKAKPVTAREQRERQHAVQIVAGLGQGLPTQWMLGRHAACGSHIVDFRCHSWWAFSDGRTRGSGRGRVATGSWLRLVIEICRACAVDWVSGVSSGRVAAPAAAAAGAIKYATNWCTHTHIERERQREGAGVQLLY